MSRINKDKNIATKTQATYKIEDTVAETTEKILEETEDRGRDDYINFYRGRGQNYPNNTFQQPSFTPAPIQASYQSTEQSPSEEFGGQAPIQVIPSEQSSGHVATTQYAKVVCFKCGYTNQLANQCALGRG